MTLVINCIDDEINLTLDENVNKELLEQKIYAELNYNTQFVMFSSENENRIVNKQQIIDVYIAKW